VEELREAEVPAAIFEEHSAADYSRLTVKSEIDRLREELSTNLEESRCLYGTSLMAHRASAIVVSPKRACAFHA
jgi:hypothetical protein